MSQKTIDLFGDAEAEPGSKPLADRMRPETLDEFAGQEHLLAPGGPLRAMIDADRFVSMVFWGPPGSGKTTLARVIAHGTRSVFLPFSAVLSGIKEIKAVMEKASALLRAGGKRTFLFVDEFHRFNRAQQDAFLPRVEDGSIVLFGATTENPSFTINGSLLSRCRVYVFHPLSAPHVETILRRAIHDRAKGLGAMGLDISEDALARLVALADGDARRALNVLELSARPFEGKEPGGRIELSLVETAAQSKTLFYDRSGEEHYNLISALHKSVRNSDVDAALYWLARMLRGGEDPLFIARRLVRIASEDVGLADPRALTLCIAAMQTVERIGLPEADCALAEAVVFLSTAPKSNALYTAMAAAYRDVERLPAEPVPLPLRNAPTDLMKNVGYGDGYRYAPELPDRVAAMDCLPGSLKGRTYYRPEGAGFERTVLDWMGSWDRAKANAAKRKP